MRVLVAVDFSEASVAARAWVGRHAPKLGVTEVLWLHVLPEAASGESELRAIERAVDELRRAVGDALAGAGRAVFKAATGSPAEEIVRSAAEFDADCVVVGTNGRRGLDRWVTGSVAEVVVRTAPCTVIVVKNP